MSLIDIPDFHKYSTFTSEIKDIIGESIGYLAKTHKITSYQLDEKHGHVSVILFPDNIHILYLDNMQLTKIQGDSFNFISDFQQTFKWKASLKGLIDKKHNKPEPKTCHLPLMFMNHDQCLTHIKTIKEDYKALFTMIRDAETHELPWIASAIGKLEIDISKSGFSSECIKYARNLVYS